MTTAAAPTVTKTERRQATPAWQVVVGQELRDLWLSPKGLTVLFGYTLLLSVMAYVAATDADLNLLDARESVGVVVQTAIGLGTLAALVVSADAISGERERGTLEALLVTPISRRGLVIGKLLAANTMWVAALVVAMPYVLQMANGPGVVADAFLVLVITGALVGLAVTALGLAVSSITRSNRVSLAASIGVLLLLAAPSQLPAITANGFLGSILIRANPVSAGLHLAREVLINQQTWTSQWTLWISPLIAAVVLTAIAIRLSTRIELGDSR
ncbi:MAG: ABC transporter permease [Acidimicrobiia bacterium]|nr:ABC transporter permease [Acidimicrobiia bacterium]